MNSYHYLLKTVFLLGLIFSVSCFHIVPLRAGTIQITDNDIRSNKILRKQIDLQLTRQFYQSYKDIQVVASFSSLNMDDKLNFYFDYNIICPEADCFLNFTVFRKTLVVNPQFIYSFDVDYLVARGLKILQLNMTSYQEHLNLRDIKSYNEKNEKEDLGKFLPINNGDAMRIMAIPNGFSNLTRTGRVVYMYTMNEDMYVVHYMQHENGHGQHDAMGWPQGVDYIKYKMLFFDASYLPNGCTIQDKWALTQNYEGKCGKKDQVKWFFGFKSTKQKSIKGYFTQYKVSYSFLLDDGSARYGTVAFPLFNNPNFIDYRLTRTDDNQKIIYLLLISSTLIVAFFFYQRKQKKVTKKIFSQAFERVDQKSETFNSERDPNQQIQNIVSAQNATVS